MKISRLPTTLIASILFVSFLPLCLYAGQTGKIVGKVTDKKSGEPVIGASVLIQGTKSGASSDFEGFYSISNVPPGTYELSVTNIGYKKLLIKNVIVKIDLTTDIEVKLDETVVEGEAVIIEAERPLVQKDLTSSSVTVSSEDMKVMPVENLSQVINLQAGVVGGHFRGGRSGEVAYLVDGVSVNNPMSGEAGFVPENASVREMEVISGTFNAEYGQAMSGVVNIVTQDGSSEMHGSLEAYIGDYVTNHTDVFLNLDKLNLLRNKNYQFSLSGPTYVLNNLSFFTTGRLQDEEGYLYGKRVYNITDTKPTFPNPNDRSRYINNNTGDGAIVPMNPYRKYSFNGKLTYTVDAFKLSYSGFIENAKWKNYDHSFKWTPDGIINRFSENWIQNFQINHIISNNTFQSLKFSLNKFTGKGYLYENPYDPRYVDPNQGVAVSNYTFRSGGNQGGRYENRSQSLIGQWTLASQLTKEHKLSIGVEGRVHNLYDHSTGMVIISTGADTVFTPQYPQLGTIGNLRYDKSPREASAYVQDKMEYGIMIINAGIRFDYFDPNTKFLADLNNPTRNHLFDTLSTSSGRIPNPRGPAGTLVKTKEKFQVSPRLGVSFPITDQGIIHFSYGHFFQIPSFGNLYTNSGYLISPTAQLQSVAGNPDIDAQRTVMYEVGLQQQFLTTIGFDFTVYYRDIRNLLGTEIVQSYEGFKYARYVNRDYGNVRGFIVSVEKQYADYYSLRADYTYQIAEGNASDPLSVYFNNQSDPPLATNKKVVPLNWDQRSTLNVSLNAGEKGDWMTGLIFGYGYGFPYTESIRVSGGLRFENGGVKPSTFNLDFRAEKSFSLLGLNGNAFMLVYNVLDIKNEYNVNDASGRANVDLFTSEAGPIYGLNTLQEYLNDPTSFSSPRNVRIGVNLDF
ncbi:MAG: TonB-dependent receptor [Bacteroidota bacterium]|nr:TonB-dependent receptor [Bacteroidota bacterium]